jgi:hypothetical protein
LAQHQPPSAALAAGGIGQCSTGGPQDGGALGEDLQPPPSSQRGWPSSAYMLLLLSASGAKRFNRQ